MKKQDSTPETSAVSEQPASSNPAPENGSSNGSAQSKQDDLVGRLATVAVVGIGVALIEVELIPGLIIGAAAAFLPNFIPSLRPAVKATVRASYKVAQKTREAFAEASEHVQDIVAEAKMEHSDGEAAKEPVAASKPA
jgi:hypothetical protein